MKYSKFILIIATVIISSTVLMASANSNTVNEVQINQSEAVVSLSGTVLDEATNEGIADAEVTIKDSEESATTDEYGTFSFEELEEGTYTITVEAEGYATGEQEVELSNEQETVEIFLQAEEK